MGRFRAYDGSHAPKEPFVLNMESIQAKGLVGWWPLNDVPGGVKDRARLHHQTSSSGTQAQVVNSFGAKAIDFNVSTGRITLDRVAELDGVTNFSLSCWVRFTGTRADYDGIFAQLNGTNDRVYLGIGGPSLGTTSNTVFGIANGANSAIYGSNDIPNNDQDYFICGTYNGNEATALDRGDIWVDGILKGKSAFNSLPATSSANASMVLGHGGSSTQDHSGLLWDVRVYDRTLSTSEIWGMYNPSTRWDLYHELGRKKYYFAPAVATGQTVITGLAAETDSAFSTAYSRALQMGLASESDSAFSSGHFKTGQVGMSLENDIALALAGLASRGSAGYEALRLISPWR